MLRVEGGGWRVEGVLPFSNTEIELHHKLQVKHRNVELDITRPEIAVVLIFFVSDAKSFICGTKHL